MNFTKDAAAAIYDLQYPWHPEPGSGEAFYTALARDANSVLDIGCGGYYGRNLDGFASCLRGGFGTPEDGDYAIEWRDHETSRQRLGYPETVGRDH